MKNLHLASKPMSFVFALTCFSCAKLTIMTQPRDADVVVQNAEKGVGKKLGKTPYSVSISELEDYVGDGPIFVILEKEGFAKENFIIPHHGFSSLTFSINLEPSEEGDDSKWGLINKINRAVLLGYQSLAQKDSEAARSFVEQIEKEYPKVSASLIIRALSFYQEGKTNEAKVALLKAQELDPLDKNIATLIEKIEQQK